MDTKSLPCREHGGTFDVPNGRGRPPVRCGPSANGGKDYEKCTKHPDNSRTAKKNAHAKTARATHEERVRVQDAGQPERARNTPRSPVEPEKPVNRSLPKGVAAKGLLEPLGWVVSGRAWIDDDGLGCASVLANRDHETISIVWRNGELAVQEYILWNREVPSLNFKGMPPRKLRFDPDELSDRELVEHLAGMKVTWWNRLAQNTETATISDKVNIEHAYNGKGDETPGERVIKFVDHNGSGYRAFYAAALIKVG